MPATGRTLDIDQLVDEQSAKPYNWLLVFVTFLATFADGYDIVAAATAGPFFVRDWHLPSPAALTFAFSATNFGVLFGAPLFGWGGDRYGRKATIILSLILFGLCTLLVSVTTNTTELALVRFVTGFGVGGVIANAVAYNAEMAPRHVRATSIIFVSIGTTLGGVFPPIVANLFAAAHGWPVIFWVGGMLPLIVAVLTVVALPESVKQLALMPSRQAQAVALVRRLRPDLTIGTDDVFASAGSTGRKARFAELFVGRLRVVTPLLWLIFAINLMVYYFTSSWIQTIITPALLKSGGNPADAQTAGLMIQLGGSISSLAISRFVDRYGLRPVFLLILCAIPSTAAIGSYATTPALIWLAFAAGFCLLGVQSGINALSGLIYPTHVRSLGVGYAFGIGRFGAFGGPAIGGILIGNAVPLGHLYLIAASPLLISAVVCVALIILRDVRSTEPTPVPATVV